MAAMTFPIETEATIRRRMLDICQSHARTVVDVTRELALMVDSLVDGKPKAAKQHYNSILGLMEESEKIKGTLIAEVASVGSLLISREDFLRLIFRMGDVAARAEAMGFKLMGVLDRKWKPEKRYIEKVSGLTSLVLKEISKVRETLHSLSFDPDKAVELSRGVEELERKMDTESRNLDIEILSSKLPLPTLLFLRDLVDRAERMADVGVDVVDLVRVLALTS